MIRSFALAVVVLSGSIGFQPIYAAEAAAGTSVTPVSFYGQIRPILQANCHGCHQPAKAKGSYVMTEFARLFSAGDSGEKPITAGDPSASFLVKQIVPANGEAEMPKGKPPLAEHDIELIRRWIAEGAKDDSPVNAIRHFDSEHPPVYTRPPVITSLDFSPDGSLLAAAGFHEVLLHRADGSGLEARLVGLSERIQSVRFSPDGKWLAAAGGQPGRMGEVQVWNVAKRTLVVSVPIGYDTVYGVSWSPDSKLVAFGCPDNTVRAIDAASGKQVLQQGSHNDWVLDTVFSTEGTHIVSVGRDMTAKLTEVAAQRFVDNITSITPGALRGGIQAIARHPAKDEILVGGSDGVPQIFQMFRQAARKIGDNATLLRRFPEMEGRVFSVDYSPDGNSIAAAASLDARGSVNIYAAQFDSTIPTNILKAYEKTSGQYTAEERAAIEQFVTSEVKLTASVPFKDAAVYTVTFSPDGKQVAAAGSDGKIRLIEAATGNVRKEIAAAPVTEIAAAERNAWIKVTPPPVPSNTGTDELPEGAEVTELTVEPAQVRLSSRNEHVQLIVTAKLGSGDTADVTRLASYSVTDGIGELSPRGRFTALKNGSGAIKISFAKKETAVPVELNGLTPLFSADFIRDVNPILSKVGCNAGTCHGAREGKNGFKLSLRGYDPVYDVRAFTDDLAARRINLASPDDSLMLLKATGGVPHEGGQRFTAGSEYYAIVRQWVADGVKLNLESSRVTGIELFPKNPVVQRVGSRQQMRVIARYADGSTRDVTAEAFIESGNGDIVTADSAGLISTLRRGEAPLLARFEGAYAATTVTVMGDRSGFVWKNQPANNRIDEFISAKWKRMKILPSDLCTDEEFIRRVSLDLTGLPPTAEEVRKFNADAAETRSKREALIERLIGSPEFVDHWANKWADLLQVNRKFLGQEGAKLFRDWIREEINNNTPYDEFARKIITASGSNRENPPASYYKILRDPAETMENTTHLFLATRFNCNKCHDHPFERWTQDQYYELAAFFAQVDLKKDEASGDRRIGGTAVESAKPLYEIVSDAGKGEVKHDRTGQVTEPDFPFPAKYTLAEPNPTRRERLAAWLTSAENRYFATSYVNRLWGYLMGVGLIEPLDDIRAGNPPSNPELLDYLTREFIESDFNTRHIVRLICQSRTYQLSVTTHEWNDDDKINFSHATARRLPAEVLIDSVYFVTGSTPKFPGVKPGTRAAQLPDSGIDLPSGFLANLGRPPRESACECERSNEIRLGSVMSLLSGPAVSAAVNDPENALASIVEQTPNDREVVRKVFLRILNRPPTDQEIDAALDIMAGLETEHLSLIGELGKAEGAWAVKKVRLDKERADAIAKAEQQLTVYLAERAPKLAAMQRERFEKIAAADVAIKEYEPALALNLARWEQQLTTNHFATKWIPLDPKEVKATGSARLERLADGSVRSIASRGEMPDYVVIADTKLTNITGIKLEVLTDANLPGFGPGHKKGNFFISEFVVEAGSDPSKLTMLKIADAATDYIEKGHDIKHTFDGKVEQGRPEGWTIGGGEGQPHWATFAFEKPAGEGEQTTLKVTIQHRYQVPFEVGRFRLWITTSASPTSEGLPAEITNLVRTPKSLRSEEQSAKLTAYFQIYDAEFRARDYAAARARKPLPEDERQKELEMRLERASRPFETDPALVQLRRDVEASTRQLIDRRLTATQDLAWALINTPAFLFNH